MCVCVCVWVSDMCVRVCVCARVCVCVCVSDVCFAYKWVNVCVDVSRVLDPFFSCFVLFSKESMNLPEFWGWQWEPLHLTYVLEGEGILPHIPSDSVIFNLTPQLQVTYCVVNQWTCRGSLLHGETFSISKRMRILAFKKYLLPIPRRLLILSRKNLDLSGCCLDIKWY